MLSLVGSGVAHRSQLWRFGKRISASSLVVGAAGLFVILGIFELISRLEILPSQWFPPVTVIFSALAQEISTGPFWRDVALTLRGWAVGLSIAAALAIPLGMLIGSFEVTYRASRAIVEFLRPIPSVALIPAAVLLFGFGLQMKVFLVAFASFWPILFQAIYGVRDVEPGLKETARAYGLGPVARFFRIVVPSSASYIATGLRISSAIALILAITAELVVGAPGLGRSIMLAQTAARVPKMYALIVAIGIIGWAINGLVQKAERSLLGWHPSQRQVGR